MNTESKYQILIEAAKNSKFQFNRNEERKEKNLTFENTEKC